MEVIEQPLSGVKVIVPVRHGDGRGFFSEVYNQKALRGHGIDIAFVQDNHSLSEKVGVLRGLHYQIPPFAQDKLVRVLRGAILDVAVDIREGSPTFGQHCVMELSAKNWHQALVPAGFAHGFVTLEPGTEVMYKVSHYWSRDHERGIIWDDPDLGIRWPISSDQVQLSDKDKELPHFSEVKDFFRF
jgi:dTDP-4-dehydrorhamnose 3,5-epimerase